MNSKINELASTLLGKETKTINKLMGGMMNSSYIILSNSKKYVLYIPCGNANELVNRKLEKDNQKLVIDLGITSKNIYFNTETGIKINEYIEGDSINNVESYDIDEVAKIFKALHSSKKLSQEDYNPFVRFKAYEGNRKLVHNIDDDKYSECRYILYKNKDWLESFPKTLCHNDAQKSNIVKSNDNKYYFIDFEFMGNNDPIYDIATFGNNSVKEGYELLKAYTTITPDIEKRYYLWRIFVSLQWYNVAISKHYNGEGAAHGYDFLAVANFFLNNALECLENLAK